MLCSCQFISFAGASVKGLFLNKMTWTGAPPPPPSPPSPPAGNGPLKPPSPPTFHPISDGIGRRHLRSARRLSWVGADGGEGRDPAPSLIDTSSDDVGAESMEGGRPSVEQVRKQLEQRVRDLRATGHDAAGDKL